MSDKTLSGSLAEWFEAQAAGSPESEALLCGEARLSYAELDARANQLASFLQRNGVGPNTLVGLCLERSPEMVIGILGILKAGGAYVPMDPAYPRERLAHMLSDSGVGIALTQDRLLRALPAGSARMIALDSGWPEIAREPCARPPCAATPDHYMYVIYTSGSTGRPKGTLVYRRGFANLVDWYVREFGFGPADRILLMSSISFDLTQKNIFAALVSGGRLVLLDSPIYDAGIIRRAICRHAITSVNCTPSAFLGLLSQADDAVYRELESLRRVFLGGESISVASLQAWQDSGRCHAQIANTYGPTECSDVCAFHVLGDLKAYDKRPVPIGRPLPNTRLYILDGNLAPVPDGTEGELCVAGVGVGAGYLNNPDLTAMRFVPDPFCGQNGGRLYRTGDRVRRLPDGNIEFLGRIDNQVKIRGFRVELGEIRAALERHPAVREAVCVARQEEGGDEKRLVAYLVPKPGLSPTISDIRGALQTHLPDYMLPTAWVFMERFPLSPNGKVDTAALPPPGRDRPELSAEFVPPAGALEQYLAAMWRQLLALDRIGTQDRFFELGGTSIKAIQFIARLGRELGESIPIVTFFEQPTIAGCAAFLRRDFAAATERRFGVQEAAGSAPRGRSGARIAVPCAATATREEVAIIGMAARVPGARDIDEFWRNLRDGVESVAPVKAEDLVAAGLDPARLGDSSYVGMCASMDGVEDFDATFFGCTPREAELMDPQHRAFLECAWSALENAGYTPERAGRVGVFGGVARNGYLLNNIASHPDLRRTAGEYHLLVPNEKDFPCTRVAYKLNLRGPAINVQTACSSSGVALHLARRALLAGECDVALVGGCRVMSPPRVGYEHVEGGTLSADGHVRAFDSRASGMIRGSGVVFLVLKRLGDAVADGDHIGAVVKGSAVNNDGSAKAGFTAPSAEGQADVIRAAQRDAGVTADSIAYVETHGTATVLGDPIEVAGLCKAFRESTTRKGYCAIGSVKTNIGHLDAGSCAAGVAKTVLALEHRQLPPSLNFERPNPNIDFANSPFVVNAALRDWPSPDGQPRRAGVSSFGLGGTNVHIVLEEAPPAEPSGPSRPWQAITLSARSESALNEATKALASRLRADPSLNLADVAYTLQVGRKAFKHRRALVCRSLAEAAAALETLDAKTVKTRVADGGDGGVVFMFPGQGAQHLDMGRGLYEQEPVFRAEMDRCAEALAPTLHVDLRDLLYGNGDREARAEQLKQTVVAQPAIFAVEYALAQLWLAWGIRPQAMIGHSVGEFAAACVSGVFGIEDALGVLAERARLMQSQPPGSMLAIRLPEAEVRGLLGDGLSLASCNAPSLCVVSGRTPQVEALRETLSARKIGTIPLHTSHAFHSEMMDPILAPFARRVAEARRRVPSIPFISSCTGTWITEAEAADPGYWAQQLRQTVRFSQGIRELQKTPGRVLLEVGPSTNLSTLALQHAAAEARQTVVPSLSHANQLDDDVRSVLGALGNMWLAGVPVDFERIHAGERRLRVALPTYAFERKRHWLAPARATEQTPQPHAAAAPAEAPASMENNMNTPSAALSPSAAPPAPASRLPLIAARLRELVAELSGLDPAAMDPTRSFLELGLDSLTLTQVNQGLKKEFGVRTTLRMLLMDLPNLNALAAYLDGEMPADAMRPAPAPTAVAVPAAAGVPAGSGALEQLIRQQMQLMAQQLALLTGAPAAVSSPVPAAAVPAATPAEAEPPRKTFGAGARISTEKGEALSPSQQQAIDAFIAAYNARTPGSKRRTQEERPHLADPRAVSGFRPPIKEIVYPIVVERSEGSRLWDVDGNEFVDMTCGFGSNFFGHRAPFVVEAIEAQLRKGYEIGPQHPLAGECARLMCELTGMERAAFCNTGSEAILGALRLARTVTGRNTVVMFAGAYHGILDEVIVRSGRGLKSVPAAPGIPRSAVENMIVLEYGTDEALRVIRERAGDLAAVLVETVQSRRPELQPREFLHQVREITHAAGACLIFDEVVTGFRMHIGGAQAHFGVRADLATYGKVIGGGMPVGVIAGRHEYMDALDGGAWQFGDESFPTVGVTYFAGTFVRHPLTLAAARAALLYLKEKGPRLQEELNARSNALTASLNAVFLERGLPVHFANFGSLLKLHGTEDLKFGDLFYAWLRHKGIFIWDHRPCYLTIAHTEEDFGRIVRAFAEAVDEMQAAGLLPGRESGSAADPSASLAAEQEVPSTEAQREIWLALQMDDSATMAYNESNTLRLEGPLDVESLRKAAALTFSRHDALRSAFSPDGMTLRVAPTLSVDLPLVDLSGHGGPDRDAAVAALLQAEVETPFDLAQGVLVRGQIVRLAAEKHLLIVTAHHIVCDGWSIDVIVRDIGKLYSKLRDGAVAELPPADRFADYALAERERSQGQEARADEDYWLRQFGGDIPALSLPTDHPRPSVKTSRGAREDVRLDADLVRRLKQVGSQAGCTFVNLLLAALKTFVYRLTGQEDLVIGLPAAGQSAHGVESLVGHCVNLLPLRTHPRPGLSFVDYMKELRGVMLDAYEHQSCTFGTLLRKLQVPREPGRIPLVPVVFNIDNGIDLDTIHFSGLEFEFISNPRRYENFELFLNAMDSRQGVVLEWSYNRDLFDAETIRRRIGEFLALLDGVARNPASPLSQLPMLPDSERRQLLAWGAAPAPYPRDATVRALFEEHARRTPGAPAAVAWGGGATLTYGELNARANRVAHFLRGLGVGRDSCVGLCFERSPDMLVAILGILKAGGAYVPLDASYPGERLGLMIADTGMRVILTRDALADRLPTFDGKVVRWTAASAAMAAQPESDPAGDGSAGDLCYVMYTSGSTGKPKGVLVTQRGVVRLVRNTNYAELNAETRALHVAPVTFDASTLEIWGPLLNGGCVVLYPGAELNSFEELGRAIRESGVNTLWLSAELFRAMVDERLADLRGVRQLLSGGDVLPVAQVQKVLDALPSCRLINGYGPTENTTFTCCYDVSAGRRVNPSVPIGRPIANTTVYILDAQRQLVPAGVAGELWAGGDGVARGYLNRPELTAGAFVPNPFADGQLYRTGDIVRFLPDGNIEFLGRDDRQAKIRGFRVEPGEVETLLGQHPAVKQSAVVLHREKAGDVRLAAYYVPREGESVTGTELRTHLRRTLPEYMVPQHLVELPSLPITPNGKLDRDRLPAPAAAGAVDGGAVRLEPQTATERMLADLWREQLAVKAVGLNDNFFDLGGHSLLAIRLVAQIKKTTGRTLRPGDFLSRTLAQIASQLDEVAAPAGSGPGAEAPGGLMGRLRSRFTTK